MKRLFPIAMVIFCFGFAFNTYAVNSKCEECHKKVTPGIVEDFKEG